MTTQVFTNKADQMESSVEPTDKGFKVSLKDLDSNLIIPTFRYFPTEEKAVDYAKEIAGLTLPATRGSVII